MAVLRLRSNISAVSYSGKSNWLKLQKVVRIKEESEKKKEKRRKRKEEKEKKKEKRRKRKEDEEYTMCEQMVNGHLCHARDGFGIFVNRTCQLMP